MQSVLVKLDEQTYRALLRLAPPASRRRAQFIRDAIRRAVREAEYRKIRDAYAAQPDSESEADDWANAEEFQP